MSVVGLWVVELELGSLQVMIQDVVLEGLKVMTLLDHGSHLRLKEPRWGLQKIGMDEELAFRYFSPVKVKVLEGCEYTREG